jgi:hypothetical protein
MQATDKEIAAEPKVSRSTIAMRKDTKSFREALRSEETARRDGPKSAGAKKGKLYLEQKGETIRLTTFRKIRSSRDPLCETVQRRARPHVGRPSRIAGVLCEPA